MFENNKIVEIVEIVEITKTNDGSNFRISILKKKDKKDKGIEIAFALLAQDVDVDYIDILLTSTNGEVLNISSVEELCDESYYEVGQIRNNRFIGEQIDPEQHEFAANLDSEKAPHNCNNPRDYNMDELDIPVEDFDESTEMIDLSGNEPSHD